MLAEPEIGAPNLRAIFKVKSVALATVLAGFWAVDRLISPFDHGGAISLAVLAALLPAFAVLVWPGGAPAGMVRFSLVVDVLALTWAIHLVGGVDAVSVPLLYPAVISLAGLLLTRADTLGIAALAATGYSAMVHAEYTGWLPHMVSYSRPPDRQLATVVPVCLYLLLYAWLVSFTMDRIRALYRRTEALRREAMHALSHDLKNPLAVIHGYARMQLEAPPEERDRFARGIERSAQQALDLASNVLDAAAFEGRPLRPHVHPVRLDELLEDVVDRYRQMARAAGVDLRRQDVDGLPLAELDGQLVSRALGNLISNAIKYTGAGGVVQVSGEATGREVTIRVADTGAGIPAAELPLLFQRYSRASTAAGIEGSGLGLFIVRRIAEAHGGSVSVESSPGQGSTFILALPAG